MLRVFGKALRSNLVTNKNLKSYLTTHTGALIRTIYQYSYFDHLFEKQEHIVSERNNVMMTKKSLSELHPQFVVTADNLRVFTTAQIDDLCRQYKKKFGDSYEYNIYDEYFLHHSGSESLKRELKIFLEDFKNRTYVISRFYMYADHGVEDPNAVPDAHIFYLKYLDEVRQRSIYYEKLLSDHHYKVSRLSN